MSAYNNPKNYNKCIYLLFQDNGDIQHTWQGPWTAAAYYFKNSHFHYSCVVLQWICTL